MSFSGDIPSNLSKRQIGQRRRRVREKNSMEEPIVEIANSEKNSMEEPILEIVNKRDYEKNSVEESNFEIGKSHNGDDVKVCDGDPSNLSKRQIVQRLRRESEKIFKNVPNTNNVSRNVKRKTRILDGKTDSPLNVGCISNMHIDGEPSHNWDDPKVCDGDPSDVSKRQVAQRLRRESEKISRNVKRKTRNGEVRSDSEIPAVDMALNIREVERHYLEKMDVVCKYCSALHWLCEKLSNSSNKNPLFGCCCLQGKIKLPPLRTPPPVLKSLIEGSDRASRSLRENFRSYNAANAFASLRANIDDRVLKGVGPRSFAIHGELHHQVGSLLGVPGKKPMYSQIYIYDSHSALEVRKERNPHLCPGVLRTLQDVLLELNELCKIYKNAYV